MAARIVGMGLQLAAVPLYLRWIGEAGYGTYALSGIIGMYIMVSDPGFSEATVAQISKLRALGQEEDAWATQRTHLGVVLVLSVVVILTALLLGLVLHIGDMPLTRGGVVAMCLLVAVQGLAFLVSTVFTAVLQALGRFTELSYVAVTTSLASVIFAVALGFIYRSPLAVIAGQTLGSLIQPLFSYRLAATFSGQRLLAPRIRRQYLNPLLANSMRELPNRIVALLGGTGDKAIIAGVLGVAVGGQYTRSARLPEALNDALQPVGSTALPELSRRHAIGDSEFAEGVVRTTLLSLSVGVSFILVPAGFGLPFLSVWLGPGMPALGPAILLGIAFYRMVQIYGQTFSMAFFAAGKPQISLPFGVFNALVTVTMTAVALKFYGLIGAVYMNVGIAAVMFLAYGPVARMTAVRQLPLGSLMAKSIASVAIGGAFTWAGYELSHQTELGGSLRWVGLACIPAASLLCVGTLIAFRLCPVPAPIHSRLSRLKSRLLRRGEVMPRDPMPISEEGERSAEEKPALRSSE
jgi:O-antigen/teichoic acid export membrane protein